MRVEAVTRLSRRRRQVPGRPPIAFRYATLLRPVARGTGAAHWSIRCAGCTPPQRWCWRQHGQHSRPRLCICGQREERCPQIQRRSISRSTQILRTLQVSGSTPQGGCESSRGVERGGCPARIETTPDDTLPSRHSVPSMSRHGTRTKRTDHELQKPDTLTSSLSDLSTNPEQNGHLFRQTKAKRNVRIFTRPLANYSSAESLTPTGS